jgi:hypothetical protein
VTPRLVFRVDEPAVDRDIEDTTGSGDLLHTGGERRLDRGRQTGGDGFVVSHLAKENGHLHGKTSWGDERTGDRFG